MLLAAVLLLVTLPVILTAMLLTVVSLRAWPLFTQTRVGRSGKPFKMIKLRTLPPEFPRYAAKYQLHHLKLPWISRTLRRLHLDELPQLGLVLVGKMSLVGPRPEMPHLHDVFDDAFAAKRTSVRPGCTGLWQISDRCNGLIYEHPEFDDYYVSNRTFRLDVWILVRSIRLMLPFPPKRMVTAEDLGTSVAAPSPTTATPAPAETIDLTDVEAPAPQGRIDVELQSAEA